MKWAIGSVMLIVVAAVILPMAALITQPDAALRFPKPGTSMQVGGEAATVPSDVGRIDVGAPAAAPPAPAATSAPIPIVRADLIEFVINAATTWLGTPYLWGGCSHHGVDCSCFVQNALGAVGIRAPRVTVDQIRWATPISAAEARAGDLVFFDNTCSNCGANPTHVGLYLGGGKMINAGDPVKIEPVYSGHNARFGRPPGL